MNNKHLEWLKQADYDIDTAEFMHNGSRCFYSVFMCHLAIEKALKGLYQFKLEEVPPKTHNLVYLLNKIDIKPDEKIGKFIIKLNEANIATRYPDNIAILQSNYTKQVTAEILINAKESLEWIKKQF